MFIVYYAVYTVELVADSTETASTRALTLALIVVSCICYVGLVVVVIVGFVLLRRKVSHNRFDQLKHIFSD